MFRNFKIKVYEMSLIKSLQKELKDVDLLTPIRLNQIKSLASTMLLEKKISNAFYNEIFLTELDERDWPVGTWFKVNLNKIMNYK